MEAGKYDRRILIEHPVIKREQDYGGEKITWAQFDTVWAGVHDVLMAKRGGGEGLVNGDLRLLVRPCKVVIRYRQGITTLMRVKLLDENRLMQIVSIAEVGRKVDLELQCEEFSS